MEPLNNPLGSQCSNGVISLGVPFFLDPLGGLGCCEKLPVARFCPPLSERSALQSGSKDYSTSQNKGPLTQSQTLRIAVVGTPQERV